MTDSHDPVSVRLFRREGVVNPRRLAGEYCFELEGLSELIRVRVYAGLDEEWYEVAQSHYLQPPGAASPSMSETQRYASVEEALADVLDLLTTGYHEAIEAGYAPDDSWLMPSRELR